MLRCSDAGTLHDAGVSNCAFSISSACSWPQIERVFTAFFSGPSWHAWSVVYVCVVCTAWLRVSGVCVVAIGQNGECSMVCTRANTVDLSLHDCGGFAIKTLIKHFCIVRIPLDKPCSLCISSMWIAERFVCIVDILLR